MKKRKKFKKILVSLNKRFHFTEFSLPDFLIIGAQKSGTTSLYSFLVQHPGIIPAERKEIHYFGNPYNKIKGKNWYTSHFCTISSKRRLARKIGYMPITGEATPDMNMPFMPKFVHELLPHVKLIAMFRDPVDRAFSQYHHNHQRGNEPITFEEIITQSPISLSPEIANDAWLYHKSPHRSYLMRGIYSEQLERWYKYYARDLIHIIDSADFFSNPSGELKKVLNFLEMPDYKFDFTKESRHKGNYTAKMSSETREYLVSVFRPYNRKLFELINRDFGWPS